MCIRDRPIITSLIKDVSSWHFFSSASINFDNRSTGVICDKEPFLFLPRGDRIESKIKASFITKSSEEFLQVGIEALLNHQEVNLFPLFDLLNDLFFLSQFLYETQLVSDVLGRHHTTLNKP